jgi:hypothetical protein
MMMIQLERHMLSDHATAIKRQKMIGSYGCVAGHTKKLMVRFQRGEAPEEEVSQ